MKKNESKPICKALFTRMAITAWCLWFAAAALLTCAVAKDFYLQLEEDSLHWIQSAASVYTSEDGLPGQQEKKMLEQLGVGFYMLDPEPLLPIVLPQTPSSYSSNHILYGKWELFTGYQAALGYYDQQGQPLFVSGDYLYFTYSDRLGAEAKGYTYVNLRDLEDGENFADAFVRTHPGGDFGLFGLADLKLRGYFEGNRFFPVEITALYSHATSVVYTAEAPDRPLVTIFSYNDQSPRAYNYDPGEPFYYNGKKYETPVSLLQEPGVMSRYGLFGAVIRRAGTADTGDRIELVIYCRPIVYAMLRLLPVYLISILLVIVYLTLYKKFLKNSLAEPLQVINYAYEADRVELSKYGRAPFTELQVLADHFDAAQQDRHKSRNQVQQLQTALDYAKNAEESRRKMISAIAHELKTPLAVIHGYAEGLQSGIAEEKKDKYLSVIMEETETMDAMVLEMLELSRLEAGKVQLSVSQFSLSALARGIFEKLAPTAESKHLQVEFDIPLEFSVAADESRIAQVITNFATNAIKYTPEGGTVRVKIRHAGDFARFAVENDSPPLSEETLAQVWDSFYRADTARDRSGTGLGLAIARNIIHLHRGTCSARNTQSGVEFQFQIPR